MEGTAYVLYVALFFLVCLEYLEKVLVGIWVIGVAGLYLVEVLDCVVELAGGLGVEGVPGADEEGGGGGGGGEGEGVEGGLARVDWVVVPEGVVTRIAFGSRGSAEMSIL